VGRKGSFINKAISGAGSALVIGSWLPWLVTPLLMIGGAFFARVGRCQRNSSCAQERTRCRHDGTRISKADPSIDVVAAEKDKINGAVRTDFILSAETRHRRSLVRHAKLTVLVKVPR
jgi:hypothetical protein